MKALLQALHITINLPQSTFMIMNLRFQRYDSAATAVSDTTPPCVPGGLAATGNDANVFLNWNDCTQPDLYGYNVYRSTASGGTYTLIADSEFVAGSQYTDYSVTNSVTYYYKVASVDTSDNVSAQTSYVSATPRDVTRTRCADRLDCYR